jgi:hypothetical protein
MHTVIFGTLTIGTVLAFLGGGIGVSIIAQVVKRIFGLSSSKVIHFVVIALAFAANALQYVISAAHANPAILASHTAEILGIATAAHTFIVSDADAFVGKVKTALNNPPAAPTATSTTSAADPTPPAQAQF